MKKLLKATEIQFTQKEESVLESLESLFKTASILNRQLSKEDLESTTHKLLAYLYTTKSPREGGKAIAELTLDALNFIEDNNLLTTLAMEDILFKRG